MTSLSFPEAVVKDNTEYALGDCCYVRAEEEERERRIGACCICTVWVTNCFACVLCLLLLRLFCMCVVCGVACKCCVRCMCIVCGLLVSEGGKREMSELVACIVECAAKFDHSDRANNISVGEGSACC